jgi:hypothetical protein
MDDEYKDSSPTDDETNGPEWDEYRAHIEEQQEPVRLEGRDYIALFIASLETIFLPLIIMIIVFVAIGILLFVFI